MIAQFVNSRNADGEGRAERRQETKDFLDALYRDTGEARKKELQILRSQRMNYMLVCALILIVGIAAFVYLQPRWLVFGVAVHDNGTTVPLGPIKPLQPPDTQKRRVDVGNYIKYMMRVDYHSAAAQEDDKTAVRSMTLAGSNAANVVDAFYLPGSVTDPFTRLHTENIAVGIVNVDPRGTDATVFDVTYTTTNVDEVGKATAAAQHWVAHVSIVVDPDAQRDLWHNPDGIFVRDLEVAQALNTGS
jgi:type IV secretory pathway TrbF-like protein